MPFSVIEDSLLVSKVQVNKPNSSIMEKERVSIMPMSFREEKEKPKVLFADAVLK